MGRVKVKMESLAMVVAILMMLVLFTGPISLLLTSRLFWDFTIRNKAVWILRRLLVAVISPLGMSVEIMFILNPLPIWPKLFAVAGLTLNTIALKREFLRSRPWALIFKPGSGEPNGPTEQS